MAQIRSQKKGAIPVALDEEKAPQVVPLPFPLSATTPSLFENTSLEAPPLVQHLKPISQKITYSKKESFLKLQEIQELALSMEPKPDFTAALRSEELKGKLFGLYQDKKSPTEPNEQMKLQTALVQWV